MKISRYIFLSFLFILLLFSITTYINFRLSEAVIANTEYFSRSASVIKNSGRFQRNILTMVNCLRGYLLTGEKSFIESYEAANAENDSMIVELSSLLGDSTQIVLLKEIRQLNDQWTDEFTEPLKRAKMNGSPGNLDDYNKNYKEKFSTGDEKMIQEKLQDKFRELTSAEYEMRDNKNVKLFTFVYHTKTLSFILTMVSVLTAFFVIIFLVRKISKRIRQMTMLANSIAGGDYKATIADIGTDELKSLGQSLNDMADKLSVNINLLKKSNEELEQYARIVSHDLKSPLRGIGNVISWIEEDHGNELPVKIREYLLIIKGRISRAENLIEGLLAYARIDREEVNTEMVDLNEMLREICDNLVTDKKIIIDPGVMPILQTERILIFQVFSNLVGNAVKYNPKKVCMVKVYYHELPHLYEFFVEDDGIGIEEIYHKKIFGIFQTLQDRDSFESTGVGLAIVKKILDSKNQIIKIKSTPGEGTIFSFTWPK